MTTLDEVRVRVADCASYNFGMRNADKLAHEDAPKMLAALDRVEEYMARLDALTGGQPVDPGLVAHIVRRNITKALAGGTA